MIDANTNNQQPSFCLSKPLKNVIDSVMSSFQTQDQSKRLIVSVSSSLIKIVLQKITFSIFLFQGFQNSM